MKFHFNPTWLERTSYRRLKSIRLPSSADSNLPLINEPASATAADRVVSIDALRGFDMFWIMGGKPLLVALAAAMIHAKEPPEWLKRQLEHTHWVGFTCYDLIMPLFMFIVGAAMPFAFSKHLMTLVPVPGLGAGVLEVDRNLATWIDLSILGSHGYRHSVPGGFTTHHGFFLPIMTFIMNTLKVHGSRKER